MGERERQLVAGVVGRPHGLDGSFHVARARPGLLRAGLAIGLEGLAEGFEVVRCAGTAERPIVRLGGVEGRSAAEALRGRSLLVARAEAPALEEDEFWAEDLEGCAVVDGDVEVGVVERLLAYPSCELLEVRRGGGGEPARELLVPMVRDAVRSVDVERRVIDVDLRFLGEAAPARPDGAAGERSVPNAASVDRAR